ncbi:DUF2147 domain-containing protein [Caulobacter segnis]
MSRRNTLLAAAVVALSSLAGAALAADVTPLKASDVYGVWRNPKGSVHIEIKPCETRTCGYVVWANPDARADVKKKKNEDLVGMQLLRDFSASDPNEWKGRVYVPDLDMTFSGQMRLLDRASLRAKGCFLVLCKTQVWTRIDTASASTGRAL